MQATYESSAALLPASVIPLPAVSLLTTAIEARLYPRRATVKGFSKIRRRCHASRRAASAFASALRRPCDWLPGELVVRSSRPFKFRNSISLFVAARADGVRPRLIGEPISSNPAQNPAATCLQEASSIAHLRHPQIHMSQTVVDRDERGEDQFVTIPLGGPIYVPDMVGPLTRVPDFENSVYQELQSLKEELSGDSLETFNEEISVDELKIIREDELVARAFEEAFKDGELGKDGSKVAEEHLIPRSEDDEGVSIPGPSCSHNSERDSKAIVLSECPDVMPVRTCYDRKTKKRTPAKRKKTFGKKKNNSFDESYIAKVEELAKIKLMQEEQKATVRLHSFDGGSRVPKSGPTTKVDKIRSLKSASGSTQVRALNTSDYVQVHFPEAVLCFEVYHNRKTWMKTQEFLVLGRQFLTEVRDHIYCLTDEIMKKAGKYDPSGYFLIEDVFCNDMRDPSAVDYSKPILDWLENCKDDAHEKWEYIVSGELQQKQKALLGSKSKQQLPRLKSTHMQSIRFCDVRFRLGAGYLYCHQGDCKHVIVIRDMRLIHPEDVQNRAAYPLVTYQPKLRYRKCSVCKIYKADKMTVDDKWAPSNPCYFCDVCYYMLHYAEGSLLYDDFRVYDYHHE